MDCLSGRRGKSISVDKSPCTGDEPAKFRYRNVQVCPIAPFFGARSRDTALGEMIVILPPTGLNRPISARSDAVARQGNQDHAGPFCTMEPGTARGLCANWA